MSGPLPARYLWHHEVEGEQEEEAAAAAERSRQRSETITKRERQQINTRNQGVGIRPLLHFWERKTVPHAFSLSIRLCQPPKLPSQLRLHPHPHQSASNRLTPPQQRHRLKSKRTVTKTATTGPSCTLQPPAYRRRNFGIRPRVRRTTAPTAPMSPRALEK